MSRRASLLSKDPKEKKKPKVRFPDELVFLDSIKENDVTVMHNMLRRVSVQIDINAIGESGMTPLHQAVVEDNLAAVDLLVQTAADINKQDADSWTPLHAACANGHTDLVRFLLANGADRNILTDDGERPYDLIEPDDMETVRVMLAHYSISAGDSDQESHSGQSDNDDDDLEVGDDDAIEEPTLDDTVEDDDDDDEYANEENHEYANEDNDEDDDDDDDDDNEDENNAIEQSVVDGKKTPCFSDKIVPQPRSILKSSSKYSEQSNLSHENTAESAPKSILRKTKQSFVVDNEEVPPERTVARPKSILKRRGYTIPEDEDDT